MSVWEHWDELGVRILKAAVCVAVTTIVAWCFRERLLALLITPYQHAWETRFHKAFVLQTLAPADAFMGYFELSLTAGIVAAVPIIFYQLGRSSARTCTRKKSGSSCRSSSFSTTLFLSGVAFVYFVAFPFTFNYFLSLLGPIGKGVEVTQIVTMEPKPGGPRNDREAHDRRSHPGDSDRRPRNRHMGQQGLALNVLTRNAPRRGVSARAQGHPAPSEGFSRREA
jgi:hypothetical protein